MNRRSLFAAILGLFPWFRTRRHRMRDATGRVTQFQYVDFYRWWIRLPRYPRDKTQPLAVTLAYVRRHFRPDQVFTEAQLDEWAERAGYTEPTR